MSDAISGGAFPLIDPAEGRSFDRFPGACTLLKCPAGKGLRGMSLGLVQANAVCRTCTHRPSGALPLA